MSHAQLQVDRPFVAGAASAASQNAVTWEAGNSETAARLLDGHADYRVLRRLRARPVTGYRPLLPRERIGVVVDTETTELRPAQDEIIEIGMVSFVYDQAGAVIEVADVFDALREPAIPIGPEITRLYDAHRAIDDCHALLEVLAAPITVGGTALGHLLRSARLTRVRIWAEGAPFDRKDLLKGRGYRWSDGNQGRPKAWFVDVDEAGLDVELSVLRDAVFRRPISLTMERLTARERYRTG